MLPLYILCVGLLGACGTHAKAVFAHFMVANAQNYTQSDWSNEIQVAVDAHIDAFALNMAYNPDETYYYQILLDAFGAASTKGFKLFFSFDYAGNGPWPASIVTSYINLYRASDAYYQYGGGPFVSTFEGPDNADDWKDIKSTTGCFFVPDWSSLGAKAAMEAGGGVADGLFNWGAWPWGPQPMDTYIDASYTNYLNGKPYMMPVSPWFYTNLPGYDKNWLWRGDDLWFDRWNEVLYVQPEWVEIISWNDWGESHYIGPLRQDAIDSVMSQGRAPFNFVDNMPHDGWRQQLPYVIDMYVQNITYFLKESVSFWYRPNPATACSSGDTYANTASQLQLEFPAAEVMEDSVFYSALLNKPAIPHVTIGGTVFTGTWSQTPDNGVGIYHGSVPFNGATGNVLVEIDRDGVAIVNAEGASITATCDMVNWNAYTGGAESTVELTFGLPDLLDSKVCVNGTGAYGFAGLCEFTCRYGYCPLGACLCREMGNQKALPKALNVDGYPAAGLDASYSGLCAFACNYGYCPSSACSDTPSPLVVPTVSPFLPPTCTGGTGTGTWEGLCSYACNFGMCPSQRCSCTSQGTLNLPPPITRDTTGFDSNADEDDWGLCRFACPRGYCPPPCNQKATDGTGDTVYIDPLIWGPDSGLIPVVGCDPPCNVVLPPYTLPSPTTILCAPLTTTLTERWPLEVPQVVESTISFTDITTTAIPVYNLNITDGLVDSMTYSVTPSVFCSATITVTDPSCSQTDTASCSETYYVSTTPTPPITITSSHKSSVSFTSTATPTPTCTKAGGCGGQSCSGPHCGGCDGSGCHTDSKGGGTDDDDKGCVGSGCGGDSGPPGGGGSSGGGSGGGGGGDGDDDSCISSTTVTDTTVFCTLYPTIGSSDVQTTCTSTEYDTTAGCSIRAVEATSYTSVGCPTLPAYVPPVPGLNDLLPTPGPQNPLGIVLNSGTYTYDSMSASPTSTTTGPTAIPTNPDGSVASYEIQWWQQYQADDGDPPAWSYTTWFLFGYNGYISDNCNSGASFVIQSSSTALSAAIPDSLPRVIVYGDECAFTKSSMSLTCASFKPATCEDIEQQSGGTCQQTTTDKVEWQGLVRCKWD